MGKSRNYKIRAPQEHDRDPQPEVTSTVTCRYCGSSRMVNLGPTSIGARFGGQVLQCADCARKVIVRG